MSLPSSKSKTQLAYARSGKATNKPKNKNTQSNDLTKIKAQSRGSTGNIYDSIMGQIDSTQQSYIKSLIVKNERDSIKNQKQPNKQSMKSLKSEKLINQPSKTAIRVESVSSMELIKQEGKIKKINQVQAQKTYDNQKSLHLNSIKLKKQKQIRIVPNKSTKQIEGPIEQLLNTQSSKRILLKSHEKTRSQAELLKQIINQNEIRNSFKANQQPFMNFEKNQKTEDQRLTNKQSQPKVDNLKQAIKKEPIVVSNNQINTNNKINPIISAINNSSSSFARKLQCFQLQYPSQQKDHCTIEQRQQRSTHKKGGSKFSSGNYFSCQTSPKNNCKNSYTKQVVITTKPDKKYINSKSQKQGLSILSPANSSNQQTLANNGQLEPNFLSCLDQYLQALNDTVDHEYNPNKSMKRNNSTKMKQLSTSNQMNSFTLGKEQYDDDFEEQTIVFDNNKSQFEKKMTLKQQKQLVNMLNKQKKKVAELKQIIDLFNQQLSRFKKKQKKMKQNQNHMIECLKCMNQELDEQKLQRRKLQQVVKQFQQKIKGISRGNSRDKSKILYQSQEDRPQRKTIYGTSSYANNNSYYQIPNNYRNQEADQFNDLMSRDTPNRIKKHGKRNSMNRYSSIINSITQDYNSHLLDEDIQCQNNYPQNRSVIREDFNKNRTQKVGKIISSFNLQNQAYDDQDAFILNQINQNKKSIKIVQPQSCKNSYLNSSLPSNKRPISQNIIDDLFNGTNQAKNHHQASYFSKKYEQSNSEDQQQQNYHQESAFYEQLNHQNRFRSKSSQKSDNDQDNSYSEEDVEQLKQKIRSVKPSKEMVVRMR